MIKVGIQYAVAMDDFNARMAEQLAGEQAIGNYGIDCRNGAVEMCVEFTESNRLRIMNTFFRKRVKKADLEKH